jgi:hypothetical protein
MVQIIINELIITNSHLTYQNKKNESFEIDILASKSVNPCLLNNFFKDIILNTNGSYIIDKENRFTIKHENGTCSRQGIIH